jgi:hypothetical protein
MIEAIRVCRIAIVDVTGNNPNVMFELGYAMARRKPQMKPGPNPIYGGVLPTIQCNGITGVRPNPLAPRFAGVNPGRAGG